MHFSVGEDVIAAHSLVLATRSDYFRGMFNAGMAEAYGAAVKVEGHSPAAFRALLSYLYTDEVRVEPELLQAVMMVAGQYLATDLHGATLRMALRCLGTHTAISYLVAAHANPEQLADLKAPALKMVVEQYDECVDACVEVGARLLAVHPELYHEVTATMNADRKKLLESAKRKRDDA